MNPAGWLRTVAGRRVQDHFRAVSRVRHLIERAAGDVAAADHADPAASSELRETRAEVRRAMDQLPDQYRLVLEWKYLDKLSVREIAERCGTTEKAAESILFRARREFRDQLRGPAARQDAERPRNGTCAHGDQPSAADPSALATRTPHLM